MATNLTISKTSTSSNPSVATSTAQQLTIVTTGSGPGQGGTYKINVWWRLEGYRTNSSSTDYTIKAKLMGKRVDNEPYNIVNWGLAVRDDISASTLTHDGNWSTLATQQQIKVSGSTEYKPSHMGTPTSFSKTNDSVIATLTGTIGSESSRSITCSSNFTWWDENSSERESGIIWKAWKSVSNTFNVSTESLYVTATFNLNYKVDEGIYDRDLGIHFSSGGSSCTSRVPYDTRAKCESVNASSFKYNDKLYITVNYNKKGCTTSGGEYSPGLARSTTYRSGKEVNSNNECNFGGNTQNNITGNTSFNSTWIPSDTPVVTGRRIQLPTVTANARGYTFSYWSYNGNIGGSGATSSKTFVASDNGCTIEAMLKANTYTVVFDLNTDDTSFVTPKKFNSFIKTFGNTYKLSETIPEWKDGARVFKGWCTTKDGKGEQVNTYQAGEEMGDPDIYENSKSAITLYALWENVVDTCTIHYAMPNVGVVDENRKFDYTMLPYSLRNPQWEDHAFIGWAKTKPASWDSKYGVYRSIADIESGIEYDSNVWYKNPTDSKYPYLKDGKWGRVDEYWGLWISSKKYICTGHHTEGEGSEEHQVAEWGAIDTVYVKDSTLDSNIKLGYWHRVTDIYVKTNDGWEHLDE